MQKRFATPGLSDSGRRLGRGVCDKRFNGRRKLPRSPAQDIWKVSEANLVYPMLIWNAKSPQ